jgi:hypothetical protein
MCFARTAFVSSGLPLATSLPAFAEDTSKPASPAGTAWPATSAETASPSADANEPEVIPEERAERVRKTRKIKICDILATKDPQGDNVSCDIVETWHEADITKDAGRPDRLALGQGSLPVQARDQARAAGEGP